VQHGAASLSKWRTAIVQQQVPFAEVICRANTVPVPAPPNKVTNNRAELQALVSTLARFVAQQSASTLAIQIFADSKYAITVYNNAQEWRNNGWKLKSGTVACNIDQAEELLLYSDALKNAGHIVQVEHVAAHSATAPTELEPWRRWFGNDLADRLTNIGAGAETDINYGNSKSKKRARAAIAE
jgi:ribonuclease HI